VSDGGRSRERPLSALPSRRARALAFAAIAVAGLCGGLIGGAFVDLQCPRGCAARAGVAALVGALAGAGGVAVVAVLVLRAMGDWSRGSAPVGSAPVDDSAPADGSAPADDAGAGGGAGSG